MWISIVETWTLMPLEMLKFKSGLCRIVDVYSRIKSKGSLCDEGLITERQSLIFLLFSAHTRSSPQHLRHKSKPYFFVPRFTKSIGCSCNVIMITSGATTFSLRQNQKIQLNDLLHWCQTNTGYLVISTWFECMMCSGQLMRCAGFHLGLNPCKPAASHYFSQKPNGNINDGY